MNVEYESFDMAVPGGRLHVGRYGRGSTVLLALHGITANHTSFHALADQLGDEFTIIAPDLRGRGNSANITGPFGMAAHADDMELVLDRIGVKNALVLGWSMGGFVSVVFAHRHPERVRRLILVDGGLPLDLGPLNDLPADELVHAVIGPSLDRLRMTFPSLEAYLDFWRPHPALADDWNAYIEEHYTYDLTGVAPDMRSGVSEEAVLSDGADQLKDSAVADAIAALAHPTVLVRAPRGLFNQVPPLYPDEAAATWRADLPALRVALVPDVNHFTILLTDRGANAVAKIVREEASAG
jgi:pimeloyl-ACP methyl ester carboxylesterase